ncbi:glutathione S-transferase family protein [Wolffia australiana]
MMMMMRRSSTVLSSSRPISRALIGSIDCANKASSPAAFNGSVVSSSSRAHFRSFLCDPPADVAVASSRSTSFGLAGSLSFSMALVTVAESKEPPSPEFLPKEVVLYQYEACPFCNKVKAFLDYHDIPYKVVEVNPLSKKEVKWSEYQKVPILMVDGEQLNNSSDIMKDLSRRIHPESPVLTSEEEAKWFSWVDDHLVHVLSPNIYRSPSEALESFDYITKAGNFTWLERCSSKYAGAAIMYFVSMKLKKKYNITDERGALYEAADTWVNALDGREFLGGSKPNLADLAVFGVLRPIRHLSAGKDMVQHTTIGAWLQRMDSAVGEPTRIQP